MCCYTIQIKLSDEVPSYVQNSQTFPLGSAAFLLRWAKAMNVNGYNIYYEEFNGTTLLEIRERKPQLVDPNVIQVKLFDLKPDTKYWITIAAITDVGEGA